jgi:cation:H+ antiporter
MHSALGITIGLLALIAGGALLVTGASQIANRLRISPMIVGLTIVAFGTSAPELVVNVVSAAHGATQLAFGNVIGSNVANLALVLGMASLLQPIEIQSQAVRREVPLLLLVTTIIMVMALDLPLESLPARIGRTDAFVLILLFAMFIYIVALEFVRSRREDHLVTEIVESPLVATDITGKYWWLLMIAGMVLLYAGAEMTVRNAVMVAALLGVSTTIIGLFVVAVGTSAPELVTSIIAAIRGESDLALGNIIGSNIFNVLFVLPASGMIGGITVPEGGLTDLIVSWLFAAALIPIFFYGRARLGRVNGVIFLVAYASYAISRSLSGSH